jgi:flagellar secretion chaperone FliS
MRDAARSYREDGVRGASPVGLVVILYQEVHRSILKAHQALLQGHIEQRTTELNHAVEVIGHLQSTLNFEKGGEVAPKLSRFYNLARAKILEANILSSKEILEWLSQEFSAHIEAWQAVDRAETNQEAQGEARAESGRAIAAVPMPMRAARSNANLPHPVRMRR